MHNLNREPVWINIYILTKQILDLYFYNKLIIAINFLTALLSYLLMEKLGADAIFP